MLVEPFTPLLPAAAAELDRQIEELAPSAAVLNSLGFAFQLAAYLAAVIKSGKPDLEELRSHGLPLETAIGIATTISKRHARKAAAFREPPPPAPKPVPAKPPSEMDPGTALSAVHTLCQQIERSRPVCLTELGNSGWSISFCRELKAIADRSKALN
jgi:hypothetical protein